MQLMLLISGSTPRKTYLINHFVLVCLHVLYHCIYTALSVAHHKYTDVVHGTIVQTLEAKAKLWLVFQTYMDKHTWLLHYKKAVLHLLLVFRFVWHGK